MSSSFLPGHFPYWECRSPRTFDRKLLKIKDYADCNYPPPLERLRCKKSTKFQPLSPLRRLPQDTLPRQVNNVGNFVLL